MLEDIDGEVWKDIPEYEGLYQISDLGRVKALERRIINLKKPCVYKPIIIKSFIVMPLLMRLIVSRNGVMTLDMFILI